MWGLLKGKKKDGKVEKGAKNAWKEMPPARDIVFEEARDEVVACFERDDPLKGYHLMQEIGKI